LDDAHELVDRAISTCLNESKPVYISVSCNIANTVHPSFTRSTIPYAIKQQWSQTTARKSQRGFCQIGRSMWICLCNNAICQRSSGRTTPTFYRDILGSSELTFLP
jgi:TPP-dependent 2-oxoacid decarboxylase